MGQLAGKRILTFGDSIIAGHLYEKAGFVEFAAEKEGMKVVRFARNGACILPGRPVDEEGIGGMILTDQIARAAKEGYDPDYVVFNGGTNDAYGPVIDQLGNAQSQSRDTDTFAGAFRATIDAIRKNWPGASDRADILPDRTPKATHRCHGGTLFCKGRRHHDEYPKFAESD